MMTKETNSLIERLRDGISIAPRIDECIAAARTMVEAADCIEALSAECEALREAGDEVARQLLRHAYNAPGAQDAMTQWSEAREQRTTLQQTNKESEK